MALTSEFIWGIVLGLVIAIIGARIQAKQIIKKQVEQQRKDYLLFAQDIINNIMRVSEDIEEARRRSAAIHSDLLALIDVEVGIYGRNREHSIRLNDDLRSEVRKYMTNVALRRADVLVNLDVFYQQRKLVNDCRARGDETNALKVEAAASEPLRKANKATDELITAAKTGDEIIKKLTQQ